MSRWGKSRAANIVEFVFDALLFVVFIAQAFLLGCLLTYGHLPLPNGWISNKINAALPEDFAVRADSYSLTLDGTIRIEDLQLELLGIEQAVFHADDTHIEFGMRWDKNKPFQLKECVLSDGRLILPAVYSPSGQTSAILERIAMRLVPAESGIRVDSFAALHEDIRLRGSIEWMTKRDPRKQLNPGEQADLFLKQVAHVLRQKPSFNGLTRPTVFFQVSSEGSGSLDVSSRLSSRAYQHDKFEAQNLTLDANLSLTEQTLVTQSSIFLKADALELPDFNTSASLVSAKVEREEWEALLKGEWPDMEVVAETLEIEGVVLESPRIRISPQAFPEIAFNGSTSGLEGAVRFSGSVNARTRSANLEAAGSIDLLSIAPETITLRLPAIHMRRAPYYRLKMDFNEGLSLKQAELRAQVDQLELAGLNFDHIRFRSQYEAGRYSLDRLYFRRDWQWLNLGFSLEKPSGDYALTLKGFAKPYDYNALLPRWWGGLFKEFDFEEMESGLGDFVIYGNTGGKAADFFFGHASAKNVAYKGVRVDEGELIVRGRGSYAEVHQLHAKSGEGFVKGDIRFTSRLDEIRGPLSVRLDLDSKLALNDAQKLFDENIAQILADFQSEALPRTRMEGVVFSRNYPEYAGLSQINITANCPAPLTYKDIPMEHLAFDLYGRKGITYLRNITLGYAGGLAEAEADILTGLDGPAQTRFVASLKDANQKKALARLTKPGPEEPNAAPEHDQGTLNFKLHARGPVNAPFQMHGFGSFNIENDALYAIQLFGPLSKLLQNTRLGFTSFALNKMAARFAIEDGTVTFEKLEINGPRTRIEAPGILQLDDLSLAMRVSVYLFGNAGNPDSQLRKFGDFITRPIPNLLEFELTGTTSNQNWRSLYDPRNYIPIF